MSQTSYAPLTEREETTSTMKHWFFADRVRSAWKRCPSRGRERDPSLLLRRPRVQPTRLKGRGTPVKFQRQEGSAPLPVLWQ
jgi:hypothetical protein